jgi:hypothetical protein
MVGEAGEPFASDLNSLPEKCGETAALTDKGNFQRSPHQDGATTLADRYGAGVEKAGVRHTPGPWALGEWNETAGYDCMTGGIRCGPVVLDGADFGQRQCQPIHPGDKARLMADACLIAAASDMLTSGKALADRDCIFDGGNIVIPCGSHGEALRLMNEFRAALSKATPQGGSHD